MTPYTGLRAACPGLGAEDRVLRAKEVALRVNKGLWGRVSEKVDVD